MKRLIFLVLISGFLASCSTSTFITGTWKSPVPPAKNYHSIMVAALTSSTIDKSTIEANVASALAANDVKALKAIDEFPPNINGTDTSRRMILSRAREKGADAVLTIVLLRNATESHYVPDYGWGWGWWGWGYPYGYYERDRIYVVENNLYDAQTGRLIWTARTKTYNPGSIYYFSKDLGNVITNKLQDEGLINKKAGAL
jgi:hypothetical protein